MEASEVLFMIVLVAMFVGMFYLNWRRKVRLERGWKHEEMDSKYTTFLRDAWFMLLMVSIGVQLKESFPALSGSKVFLLSVVLIGLSSIKIWRPPTSVTS